MTLSAQDWITSFARELGVLEPNPEEVETLLALAGVAAHFVLDRRVCCGGTLPRPRHR
jgi:hypothetical protein